MILCRYNNVYDLITLLVEFSYIYLIEISNVCFYSTFSNLDIYNSLLVSDCCYHVPILLVLVGKVWNHLILFQLHLSVFRLEVDVKLGWLLGGELNKYYAFLAGLFSKTLGFSHKLFSFLFGGLNTL